MSVYNNVGDTVEGQAMDCDGRVFRLQGMKKHPITKEMMSLEEDLGYIRKWGQTLVTITADGLKAYKRTLKRDLLYRAMFAKTLSWSQVIGYIVGIAGGLYGLLK